MSGDSADLSAGAREVDGARVLGATVDIGDAGTLREMADQQSAAVRDYCEKAYPYSLLYQGYQVVLSWKEGPD